MFYSYDILHPRKGKFAIVWLAATGHLSSEKRRDKDFRSIMAVKVSRTCEDIIKHLDSTGSGGRQKFSLYLSSMLTYGTVKIYHRQVRFLLEETMNIYKSLQRQCSLMLELDVTVPGPSRVTLQTPEFVEGLHFTDFDDFSLMPPPSSTLSRQTPRKHALVTPSKKQGRASATPSPSMREEQVETMREEQAETLREEQAEDTENISLLLRDWEETPTRARVEDITLREQILLPVSIDPHRNLEWAEKVLGPLDFGPPFCELEGPLAIMPVQPDVDTVKRRLDLEGRDDQRERIDGDRRLQQEQTLPLEEEVGRMALPSAEVRPIEPRPEKEPVAEDQSLRELLAEPLLPAQEHLPPAELEKLPPAEQEQLPPAERISELPVAEQQPIQQVAEASVTEPIPEQQPSFIEPAPVPPQETRADISRDMETPRMEPTKRKPKRPEKAPPSGPDVTPVVQPQPERIDANASQIRLSPVGQMPRQPVPKLRRRERRLIIDRTISLPRTELREQCQNPRIALRCDAPSDDMIDVRSSLLVDSKKLLSSLTHRKIMAEPLKKLITRHYRTAESPTDISLRGYFEVSPDARRHLEMSSVRLAPGERSNLAETSISALESSKDSMRKSFLQVSTGQLEASVLPLVPELIPIQEEQVAGHPLEVTEPFLINGAPIEPPPVQGSEMPSGVHKPAQEEHVHKQPKRTRELDESITVAPESAPVPRETTFGLFESPPPPHHRGPPPSPMEGLQQVTVEVDIHHPQSVERLTQLPPVELTPERQVRPRTKRMPNGTSEIPSVQPNGTSEIPSVQEKGGSAEDHLTASQPKRRHLTSSIRSMLDEGGSDEKFVFEDFLPQDPTRKDAASTFAALLEMHKRRVVDLSQEENYDTIYVKKL
ncbi:titin-like isoform X2 [Macrobrachium nipponense]|uniref:titin-like isoform X2 n=1 Tax=Macrobrachium nipponense TaxID=159736 RepID=UPI0030C89FE7